MDGSDGAPTISAPDEAASRSAAPGSRRRPRWCPLGAGAVVVLVVGWAFITAWTGLWGSHPAGWITLLVALAGASGLIAWAWFVGPPTDRRPWVVWLARGALGVGTLVLAVVLVYVQPMSAQLVALDALDSDAAVRVDDGTTEVRMTPTEPLATGLAFYPGARVDPRAYARVLRPVAEAGYPVVIFKQPYNLAILSIGAADAVVGDPRDDVDRWVIGGHSLGVAMASSYAESDRAELVGLLFYAAFPVNDMSARAGLDVTSVSGTNDTFSDVDDIAASVAELPPSTEFVAIDGAIHSFFGDYGFQNGDGDPTISREDAQAQIVAATIAMMDRVDGAGE